VPDDYDMRIAEIAASSFQIEDWQSDSQEKGRSLISDFAYLKTLYSV